MSPLTKKLIADIVEASQLTEQEKSELKRELESHMFEYEHDQAIQGVSEEKAGETMTKEFGSPEELGKQFYVANRRLERIPLIGDILYYTPVRIARYLLSHYIVMLLIAFVPLLLLHNPPVYNFLYNLLLPVHSSNFPIIEMILNITPESLFFIYSSIVFVLLGWRMYKNFSLFMKSKKESVLLVIESILLSHVPFLLLSTFILSSFALGYITDISDEMFLLLMGIPFFAYGSALIIIGLLASHKIALVRKRK